MKRHRSARRRRPRPQPSPIYLAARSAWTERAEAGIHRVIAAYQAVIAADPEFAPAWSGLAETYVIAADYGAGREAENYPKAREFAERALAIDAGLASACRALASYQFGWMRDTLAAGRAFRRAIELAPNDVLTRIWLGNALTYNGEYAAAHAQYDIAQLADAGPLPLQLNRAWLMWLSGHSDRGIARLRELSERSASNPLALELLGQALLGEGGRGRRHAAGAAASEGLLGLTGRRACARPAWRAALRQCGVASQWAGWRRSTTGLFAATLLV